MNKLQSFKMVPVRLLACLMLTMAAFSYNLASPITDSFHEGEYLGALWTIKSYLLGETAFPLLVHGPMDFLPALLASHLSGDQSVVVLTRAINTLLAAITWVLFGDILVTLARRNKHPVACGFAGVVMFFGMILVIPGEPVERQQAFLAVRDTFLLLTLWCSLRGLLSQSPTTAWILLSLGGAAAAASLYWAYDRFLASMVFCCALVVVLLLQRAWRPVIALTVGGATSLLAIPLVAPTGSFVENAQNLIYWVKFSGEVWYIPYVARILAVPTLTAMIVLFLFFSRSWFAQWKKTGKDVTIAFSVGLLAIQAFFIFKYFNLPRQPNNYYFVWPFVLLVAGISMGGQGSLKVEAFMRGIWEALAAGGLWKKISFSIAALSFVVIVTNNMLLWTVLNLRTLSRLPPDVDLFPQGIRAASKDLALPNGGCVLLWSNEGIFTIALRRPFCSRYMYPVYTSASHESEFLKQISVTKPAVVVFDTPFWSMNIYGRTMQQRLPTANEYLLSQYKFSMRGGYTIGLRRPSPQRRFRSP